MTSVAVVAVVALIEVVAVFWYNFPKWIIPHQKEKGNC